VKVTSGVPAAAALPGLLDPGLWPDWLVWFLALYGLALLVAGIWEYVGGLLGRREPVPLVSLVVPVKDREDVIEGAVRSFVARYGRGRGSGPAFELIFVDAHSSDDTPRILRRLACEYPGVVRLRFGGTGGTGTRAASAAEAGLAEARGDVVLLAALEELAEPGLLERVPPAARGPLGRVFRAASRGSDHHPGEKKRGVGRRRAEGRAEGREPCRRSHRHYTSERR